MAVQGGAGSLLPALAHDAASLPVLIREAGDALCAEEDDTACGGSRLEDSRLQDYWLLSGVILAHNHDANEPLRPAAMCRLSLATTALPKNGGAQRLDTAAQGAHLIDDWMQGHLFRRL